MALYGALQAWRDFDAEGMMAWAARQDRRVLRRAFTTLYENYGVRDPKAVLELVARYPDAAPDHIRWSIGETLIREGSAGWAVIEGLPAGPLRDGLAQRFAGGFATENPEAAWRLALDLPAEERAKFIRAAIYPFAKSNPAELTAQLARDGGGTTEYAGTILSQWAERDPHAALAWARGAMQGNALTDALAQPFREWAAKDPSAALAEWARLPPGLRAKVLPSLATDWAEKEPEAAAAWAVGLGPIDRRRALAGVFRGWTARDPMAAAEAALRLSAVPSDTVLETIVDSLVEKDAPAALAWASRLPAEQAPRMAENALRAWASRDAVAAAEHLGTLAEGPVRDRAVYGFAQAVSGLDPATAAAWAQSLGDAGLRERALRTAVGQWVRSDPGAARSFAGKIAEPKLRGELLRLVETGK